jgi:guanylate kinase
MNKAADYRPNQAVLDRLKQVDFVAFVGPTASGKSTLIYEICQRDPAFSMVRSTTSRSPRPGEIERDEFHFRTREEMQARINRGEYVQVAPMLLEYLYATAPEDYSTKGIAVMPVVSASIPDFRALPFASFRLLYILPPSYEVWQQRVVQHGFDPAQLGKRLAEARQSLQFALTDTETIFIVNGDLAATADQCIRAARGGQVGNQQTARAWAKDLLEKVTSR